MKRVDAANCPVCGPVSEHRLFNAIDRLYGIEGQYTYAQCPKCDLVFLATPVKKEDIAYFYPDSYSAHHPYVCRTEVINNGNRYSSKLKRLIQITKGHISQLRDWLKGTKIKRFIYRDLSEYSRVLDVGCGTGEFLYGLKVDKKVQAYGIEVSKSAAKRGSALYELEIFNGELSDAPFKSKSFDLITAWWSLEHIPDPEEVIIKMKQLLRDEGNIIIGIPNSKSINAWIFQDCWYHLDCPRHLHLWNISAISMLLKRNGLKITSMVFDKTPWGLLGSLQYLIYQNNYSKRYKDKITRNYILYILALPWAILVGLLKLSDIMVIYCKKEK